MKANNDNDALIAEFGRRRQGYYCSLKTWREFGKGWTARNANCVKIAQACASGSVGPDPVQPYTVAQGACARAYDDHMGTPAITPTGGGIITAGGGTAR